MTLAATLDALRYDEDGRPCVDGLWFACPTCEDETYVPEWCEPPRCATCAECMEPSP